jgi:SRSO17 transposase
MAAVAEPDRFAEYLALFHKAFRRRDQARWAGVYCQGLLRDLPRKNVETLARHVVLPPGLEVADVTQALHNFINHSSWVEQELWRRYRALLAERLGAADGIYVLDEVTIPKRGEHSVGVQRQYSATLGQKLNCQLAVVVHYVTAAGACPLALRLYLPSGWQIDPERMNAVGVPLPFQRAASKLQVGLDLLTEIRAEGFPGKAVTAGAGMAGVEQATDELQRCRLVYQAEGGLEAAAGIRRELSELGLAHFEGRSWRGFHHHACLVMLAHGFRQLAD